MFLVRYPTGLVVRYNDASYMRYLTGSWELYTKEGGAWIASIMTSSGATVEAVPACSVGNSNHDAADRRLRDVEFELRRLKRRIEAAHPAPKKS